MQVDYRHTIRKGSPLVLVLFGLLFAGCDAAGPSPTDPPTEEPPTSSSAVSCAEAPLEVLHAFDAALMPSSYEGEVVAPGSAQIAVVEEAFGLMPPLLCHAVDYVAFKAYAASWVAL